MGRWAQPSTTKQKMTMHGYLGVSKHNTKREQYCSSYACINRKSLLHNRRQAATMIESFHLTKTTASVWTSARTGSLQASNLKPTSSYSSKTQFSVGVRLRDTGEAFIIKKCRFNMKIRELKSLLELLAGIPTEFQRLCYLDKGVLMDESSLRYNDIVPGTTISMMIWHYDGWAELVTAAVSGDVNMLRSVMSKPAPSHASHPRLVSGLAASWRSHRLFSALFISAHRGHMPAVCFLLQNGADVKAQTPLGRGALHAAAARSQTQCIRELMSKGASLHQQDSKGQTAINVAKQLGQIQSVRQLFLFDWQERAAGVRTRPHLCEWELFPHQRFDSHLKTWFRGPEAQQYIATLQGRGTFRGIPLGAFQNIDIRES